MEGMTQAQYLKAHPEAAQATYLGEKSDQGRIVAGPEFPNEGYAILKCGNTEIKIGYSLLCAVQLKVHPESMYWGDLQKLQKGIHAITCEAAQGRKGD